MIRENQNIALVFAGIATGVLDILNGKSVTFLRRAKPEELDAIPLDDLAFAFSEHPGAFCLVKLSHSFSLGNDRDDFTYFPCS